MKTKFFLTLCLAIAGTTGIPAQTSVTTFNAVKDADRTLLFDINTTGRKLPILWGLDTAWPSEENIRRGVSYMGSDIIKVARVSFQPWEFMAETNELPLVLENNLRERLRLVSLIGGPDKVKLALNNDAPDDKYDHKYSGAATDETACRAYCNLIYGTMKSCQDKGWTVVSASPLNEPDYVYNNQGSKDDFLAIARMLKESYPGFKDGKVRISGGNTLNCDEAMPWYTHLSEYIDEGNTHQLAGDFEHYADFFKKVRDDGKYATADELHNVMEAMVGVEYGMQTGIWWGTAELARGEFCKASDGERLAYAENRPAWTAASVYRAPDGRIQAFCGSSERQATASNFRFVSTARDVFFDGHGPCREYVVDLPGGNGYQQGQTNAECVVDITWGEDIRPVINGEYILMNAYSKKVLTADGELVNFASIIQKTTDGLKGQLWEVKPAPITIGGDFSYYTVKLAENPDMKLDVNNWSLEDGGGIILYNGGLGNNEQWRLRYEGDGYFSISSRHSNLCLEVSEESTADGVKILQATRNGSPRQLWRLLPANAQCETDAPDAPSALTATGQSASIRLEWNASPSADVAGYTVLRAEKGNEEFNTVGRGITGTSFIDNSVTQGVEYTYKVKAVDRSLNTSATTTTVTASTNGDNALIAHYKMDDNLLDETENAFHGSTTASLAYFAAHDGKGVRTRTKEAVQLPYQVANLRDMTVATWVRCQDNTDGIRVFDFGNNEEQHLYLSPNEGGVMKFAITDGVEQSISSNTAMPTKTWNHIAVTLDDNGAVMYLNGQKVAEGNISIRPADFMPVLNYIGRGQSTSIPYLFGAIDDFRVYNHALNAGEINAVMNGSSDIHELTTTSSPIISTEYYNLNGARINSPQQGVYIVREIHADGSVTTGKKVVIP